MNEVLIKTMAIAAFTVTIMGGILLPVLMGYWIFRLLASIWSRMSALARNTREYLENKADFDIYKSDVEVWDNYRKTHVEKCQRCEYRRKSMEEADHE